MTDVSFQFEEPRYLWIRVRTVEKGDTSTFEEMYKMHLQQYDGDDLRICYDCTHAKINSVSTITKQMRAFLNQHQALTKCKMRRGRIAIFIPRKFIRLRAAVRLELSFGKNDIQTKLFCTSCHEAIVFLQKDDRGDIPDATITSANTNDAR